MTVLRHVLVLRWEPVDPEIDDDAYRVYTG